MSQEIKLEIVDDKIKVTTPYNKDFVEKARNFRGKWHKEAWWFDDSILEYVRDAMMEVYGTTGEQPVEYCSLLIKDYSDEAQRGPVELFGRVIARAFGRDSGAKLGEDIVFISGDYRSGGSVKNWYTELRDATFEIQNFPLPRTEKEDVQKAIKDGWCEIKKRDQKPEIKTYDWNDPEMYRAIAPFAMDRKVIRDVDNPITTKEGMKWFLKYKGADLIAFCAVETTNVSWTIKNFYAPDGEDSHKFEFIEVIKQDFQNAEVNKLYCFFKTDQIKKAAEYGFKETTKGKNWHRLVIEKQ